MPDASVLIPHYGDPRGTDALVAALGAAGARADLEILVVDDASPTPYPRRDGVRVHRRARNGGYGAAVNSGARRAEAPLLVILNSDVVVADGFVDDLLAAAARHPGAVVAPRVMKAAGVPEYNARRFPRVRHWFVEWLVPLSRYRDRDAWHRAVGHDLRSRGTGTAHVDWVVGSAFAVPRDVLLRAGGFDERYHMNSEEVDLQRRLAATGVPVVFAGHVSCVHPGGASSGEQDRRAAAVWRSRLRYVRKWDGRAGVVRMRAALGLATAINLGWRLGRRGLGRPGSPWRDTRREIELLRLSSGPDRAAA